jgi:phosphatidylinositol alpha-1,6-mannosyltransferase
MIHSARVLPEGVMALALKWQLGVPYICYVHGEDVATARDSREYVFLVRRVLQGARLLVANSHNTRRILCDEWNVPADRVTVLHPGVDTSRFVPAPRNIVIRQQLGWNDRPVILTVGRLQKRKGHDQMIRAVRLLKDTFPDILYVAIGDGEERCTLERLIQEEQVTSNVKLVGELDDRRLIECYQQCDLFILPNRQVGQDIEGFGMVLLEAQACGKPAIAGRSGGTSEAINAPATGRIIPCEHPDTIAKCVAEMLREPAQLNDMGRVGRNWVVANFDWRTLAVQAGALFDSCYSSVA